MVETTTLKEEYLNYVNKIDSYKEALSLMFWDLRTGAPKKGADRRSDVIGMLSSEVFNMSTSEEMASYLTQLLNDENMATLDETTKASLDESKKNYERNKKFLPRIIKIM